MILQLLLLFGYVFHPIDTLQMWAYRAKLAMLTALYLTHRYEIAINHNVDLLFPIPSSEDAGELW